MITPPTPLHTHTWDGTRALPDWLPADAYRWDGTTLVIRHPDGDTPMRAGWTLVQWTDGMVTVASPRIAERVHGPGGLVERLAAAEATVRRVQALAEEYPVGIPTNLVEAAIDPNVASPAASGRHTLAATEVTKEQP